MKYDFTSIESKWQAHWETHRTFAAPNPGDEGFDPKKPKYYVLDMFPYPSGVGLHVGHPLGYIATDIVARYKRMRGFSVLHPMGYDAFGLPAEQFAVESGVHPAVTTQRNTANMTRQLKRLGLSYDWDRCVSTTDTRYYKWTQWIFLQVYNSWFDPARNRAAPIGQLRQMLESEQVYAGVTGELITSVTAGLDAVGGTPIGVRRWHELTSAEQLNFIDQHRLAYIDEIPVNWCPALGTVLANEEVTNDGRSERGDHPVYKRPLRQWMLRITAFAERLIEDLEDVDWPEPIKAMQRNWIGRSVGAAVEFAVADSEEVIRVFTTRPDTLFGATYMVLAPEHPLIEVIATENQRQAVTQYQQQAGLRSEVERMAETRTKTGAFTGAHAINPTNQQRIPIWIADYVMMGYGTGAIMAVPAHDQRDFEFAKQFGLPIRVVVMPDQQWLSQLDVTAETYLGDPGALNEAFVGEGTNVNSASDGITIDGLETPDAKKVVTQWLATQDVGDEQVQYKLRDWLFSRQRYWGEPFPIVHGPDGQTIAVAESELPVELPDMQDFKPPVDDAPDANPQPPLSRAPESWRYVSRNGARYEREFNTMPQWAGSCWYYLRFLDPKNDECFVDSDIERYWMAAGSEGHGGVDLYVGGAEHAVLHLLYARFWHKVLYDLGEVSTPEPFGRLFNQGYIQASAFKDSRGMYVPAEEVEESDGQYRYRGQTVAHEYGKMGKSLKNAVAPDDICEQYGCDSLRLYEMYLGPLDQSKPWRTQDIVGVHRFLQRVWRNFVDEVDGGLLVLDAPASDEVRRMLHRTIKKVTQDMERMSFNTAIAALIELNNILVPLPKIPREVAEPFAAMLSPMAPHIGQELWSLLGHDHSLTAESWPSYDEAMLVEAQIEYPVSVNGKLRGRVTVATDADKQTIEQAALADSTVQRSLDNKTVRKVIVVPKRMVNIVAS